ncbi:tripartite tricarboxylate transporter permease [Methanimicrococcus blatticola]|uniref:Putative membrane protein n=1 Tax=Methanimicrococcus blatticola TaxID=91560 RepID=A0A484F252_9EURY|nr:tripartite tricarboxylate transporter permease [Methanimicrococcus blatticola]MBZ3936366.1 tripartite tricarboxylate transporter permease [Methanimicrococcus blatticola]MCC2509528.1 tripartite tricarboxylate transporter permease [Methanimicrococcus blatticola]TDQ67582.1 putative membrane protein [Methanimicrococcus blatticola]
MITAAVSLPFEILFENFVCGFIFCVVCGWIFGLLTGMIPGIHVNNIAVILASAAAFLYGFGLSPVLLSAVILSCAVSHTFHNIIPAIFLGAPGEETVFAVLPGHKLLIAGEGLPAVRLSALGSAAAVIFSFLMILPTAFFLSRFYPLLETKMGFILLALSLIVLLSEKKISKIISATIVFLTAGVLGVIAFEMDGSLTPVLLSSSASVLMPLLGGLFGVPQLIISLFSKSEIYDVHETGLNFSNKLFLKNAVLGTAAGAFVSWIPGVSSSVAAILAGFFKKNDFDETGGDFHESPDSLNVEISHSKEYIVIVSAINTANAVFGLLAFFIIGKSRNGAVVSIRDILSAAGFPLSNGFSGEMLELFILFYAVIMISAFFSYFSTIYVGKIIPEIFQKIDYRKISAFVLLLLTLLIFLMSGSYGLILFAVSVFIGFLPVVLHVRKSNLMGVILFPVMLYFLGLR